jgi:allantoinase
VKSGAIDTLGSDHSPAPPEMKVSTDACSVWGGIASCQHGFALVLAELFGSEGAKELQNFAAISAVNVAKRFNLDLKGSIARGAPADLVLIAFDEGKTIPTESLLYRHQVSPYVGRTRRAQVRWTWLRGRHLWRRID